MGSPRYIIDEISILSGDDKASDYSLGIKLREFKEVNINKSYLDDFLEMHNFHRRTELKKPVLAIEIVDADKNLVSINWPKTAAEDIEIFFQALKDQAYISEELFNSAQSQFSIYYPILKSSERELTHLF